MSLQSFASNKTDKHESICFDGMCYRFDRTSVKTYQKRFRRCDQCCNARVLFNSSTDFKVVGNHSNCTFDHHREFQSRRRMDVALDLLKLNVTESPQQIVDRVLATIALSAAEKLSLKMFVMRKHNDILVVQSVGSDDVIISPTLKVALTPQTVEKWITLFDVRQRRQPSCNCTDHCLCIIRQEIQSVACNGVVSRGVYRVVPRRFATLYTIHTLIDDIPYPFFS